MKKSLGALAASAILLAGCGGGGGDGGDDNQTPPETDGAGFYSGSTSGNHEQLTFVFEDGTYYAIYADVDSLGSAGFIVGSGVFKNGSFASNNAKEFHSGGTTDATVSASYVAKQTFNGHITLLGSPAQTLSFTGNYADFYEQTPVLSTLVGTYDGIAVTPLAAEESSLTVASDGTVSGTTTSGCNFSGTVKPKTTGNAFDVDITLGAAPCPTPGQKQKGMLAFEEGQLFAILATSNKSTGTLFVAEQSLPR